MDCTTTATSPKLTCNMVAVSTIFARALLKTVQSVCSDRTRMFTREPNVAGPTHIFSGNMVTSPVSCSIKRFTEYKNSQKSDAGKMHGLVLATALI